MNRYKITLTPIDWFFFGGEQTFDNGETQSFIARSNPFPQQTALLGMVRYQLLKQKGLLLTDDDKTNQNNKQEVQNLIGQCSFNNDAPEVQTFGKIKSLSPVFIQRGCRRLVPMPLTHGFDISFTQGDVWLSGKRCKSIIQAPSFNEKTYGNFARYIDDQGNAYGYGDIFTSAMQIGITKTTGVDNKDGFFNQETLRFRDPATSFAFYLELEDGATIRTDQYVFLGAQRSCFFLRAEFSDEQPFLPGHPDRSILLCSPAYIADVDKLAANCLQHWSGTCHFRNLQQSPKGNLNSGLVRYQRHHSLITFLTAGSVIFYENDGQLKKLQELLNNKNLQNIGYNQYDIK